MLGFVLSAKSRARVEASVQRQSAPLSRLLLGIVRLGRAQQIPAERTAGLERNAETDFEPVRCLQRGDQTGLTLGAFDRPFAKPKNVASILIAGLLPQRASQKLRQGHDQRLGLLDGHLQAHGRAGRIEELEPDLSAIGCYATGRQLLTPNFHHCRTASRSVADTIRYI